MAELSKKRRGEIQKVVLEILLENPEGIQAKNIIAQASNRLTLTEFEKADYPNSPGVRRFDKTLRFLTIGPVKAGWMTKEKGIWSITETGERALREFPSPENLVDESTRLYHAWKKEQPTIEVVEPSDDTESTTVEEAEELAWEEISDYLSQINPFDFQELVSGLLKGMGYHISWISPPGPDKGIDILAHKNPIWTEGPRLKVQVKRTPNTRVSAETLRAFMSTLGDSDVGLFVASGGFTRDAEKEAREQEKRRLTLLDAEGFFDLWVANYKSIPDEEKLLLPLRFVPFLAPDN